MINSHTSVGIAQVVFYTLVLPVAIFVLIRNWKHGLRLASYPLVTFSLARLAGGILTILRQSDPTSIGLIIATTVLLNVGLIPLMISMVGFIRLIMKSSLDENKRAFLLIKIIRIAFIAAIVLLCVAGAFSGTNIHLSRHLTQAGYVTLAAVIASIPTLVLRTVYGLLCAFTIDNVTTIWNSLVGSAVAFALMCLLAEYITLLIFLYLGIRHWRDVCAETVGSVEMESLRK
ncbi:hypothetical protein FPANT_8563 [Fusarium pseudoanthophilum]|uniref:DUF7702 domain-containing protein n=1 Tax=Fusarium pseudoanthophilum TaxID=48495 RepID=A0A8H5NXK2_9HYPO|nr:hypothetical protein FPANT_8563 [Fusarium pseudoanthophilum]